MGKTITEKILARAAGKAEVSVGEYVWVTPKTPLTIPMNFHEGPIQHESLGVDRVYDPDLFRIVYGHRGLAYSVHNVEQVTQWAERVGIPERNIYNLGRSGIEHVIAEEHCWALPGEVNVSVVNGHTTSRGALGAFAFALSYEKGAFMLTGKTWIQVPETAKFEVTGHLQKGVTARDVFDYILGQIGGAGAADQVMEWTGPVIDEMDMDGRFTLCSNSLFTGAWTAIMNPDEKALEYVRAHTKEPFEPLVSDPDASFAKVYSFDVSNLEPQVIPPPSREIIKPVSEFEGVKINKGFIGTCLNARLDDMRIAAAILKGKKVHPGVLLNITPATVEVFRQCMREGIIDIFMEAEALVPAPCCGMCGGGQSPLISGDVCISSSPLNYAGRMGSPEAEIYLASPATVAASCVEGRITDPRNYL
ncbi:aconitase family protein [Chloroflexota bacterium]